MKRMVCLLVVFAASSVGCRSPECEKMQACCAEVADEEWSGDACGPIAEKVRNVETCRTIVETIRHSLQSREEPVPEPCQ